MIRRPKVPRCTDPVGGQPHRQTASPSLRFRGDDPGNRNRRLGLQKERSKSPGPHVAPARGFNIER